MFDMFAVLNRAGTMLKRCAKSADAKFTNTYFPTIDMVRAMAFLLKHKIMIFEQIKMFVKHAAAGSFVQSFWAELIDL